MADRVLLFDFDGTLLNTGGLFQTLTQVELPKITGHSREEIEKAGQVYLETLSSMVDFDPDKFIESIATSTHTEFEIIKNVFYNPELYKNAVFPEVRDVIAEVAQRYPIGIFSQGVVSWQKHKLDLAGLTELFDPKLMFITPRKTTATYLATLPKPCIIVDDNTEVITRLQHEPDIAPIFIDRIMQSTNPNTIHSLTGLLTLI